MSYREEDGRVIIDLSRGQFQTLLLVIDTALGSIRNESSSLLFRRVLELINEINRGNPNFTPYRRLEDFEREAESGG